MKKKIIFFAFSSTILLIMIFLAFSVDAQTIKTNYDLALGNTSPLDLAVGIINWGLGILALIAVVIILWGGITWMTSGGQEEKIEQAKKIIRNGVIGLVIILASWGIAYYLINRLFEMTNPPNGGGPGYSSGHYTGGNPFMVDHTNPADEENDVTLCHLVAATFTLPVDHASINENTFYVYIAGSDKKGDGESCAAHTECKSSSCENGSCVGEQMAGTYAFSEEPSYSAVWYPTQDYQSGTTYRVELTTDVVGLDEVTTDTYKLDVGDPKRIFDFTTGTETDIIPPKIDVLSVTPFPGDEETNVCRQTPIQVSFSESMDPASIKDENVWLYDYAADQTVRDTGDELASIRLTSIGGQADDTFITSPQTTLEENTYYGVSLYSGAYDAAIDSVRANYTNAIRDTCGNPISGDFDDDMEGNPTDDFTESTSAGLNYDYCYCSTTAGSCRVDIGGITCDIDGTNTCTLGSTCAVDDTREDYIGYDHQWTFQTGTQTECIPDITGIAAGWPDYYSEDKITFNDEKAEIAAGSEDSDKVVIRGEYLYPFYDVDFNYNISAAGLNCFDKNHQSNSSCFVSNNGSQEIIVRTPVGSITDGKVKVENEYGSDYSDETIYIESPYIRSLSPSSGPVNQFVTVHGSNFIDYDPSDPNSEKGKVYFEGEEVETPCADGWDDNQIIIKIPEDFKDTFSYDDYLEVQVVTVGPNGNWENGSWNDGNSGSENYDDKFSNKKGFTFIDGSPGPGVCALDPDCSDTGADDVSIVGPDFGGTQGEAYFVDYANSYTAAIQEWNTNYSGDLTAYNTGAYKKVLTNQTPVTTQNVYEVSVGIDDSNNEKVYSNSLNFDLPCQEAPALFMYSGCDLENTFFLPNPRPYEDNACVNSTVLLAFTQDMDNSTVRDGVKLYSCGTGDYNSANCTNNVSGSFTNERLNNAYFGGDGLSETDYEEFDFMPASDLSANTWYLVTVPQTITNNDGVALDQPYSWHFKVRDSSENCVVDIVDLRPGYIKETAYDIAAACPTTYETEDGNYTYKARPFNSDCFSLRNDFSWHWNIDNNTNSNIIKFSDRSTSQNTDNGYNTVCMQGNGAFNYGIAYVEAGPKTEDDSYPETWPKDDGMFEVDFGYCTSDADCINDTCQNSTCDLTTSHCTPEITSFLPATIGPGGCVTIAGCYFGPTRGTDGKITFGSSEADYLNDVLCNNDTWRDDQIIGELKTSVTPGNYDISVTSYNALNYTYPDAALTTQADTTPCLCAAVPNYGHEGDSVSLYGKYFDRLVGDRYAEFYNNNQAGGTWLGPLDSAIYGNDAYQMDTTVPYGATSSATDGVKLVDDNDHISNPLAFYYTCSYNSDCPTTHCCHDGFCQSEEVCNACVDSTDCEYGSCKSPCTDGVCTPYITAVSPPIGNTGQPVTIQGCHFGSYYSPDDGTPYSKATFNNEEAELACDVSDSWNNEEVKVIAPSNIFSDSTEAVVSVLQVYRSGSEKRSQDSILGQAYCTNGICTNQDDCERAAIDGGCQSSWQTTTFTKSDLCDNVDIPVLCRVREANGYFGDTVNFEGYYFYNVAPEQFCSCTGNTGETCRIPVGDASCPITHEFTCYADPNNTSTACNSTIIGYNSGYNTYMEEGCSLAIYTNETDCINNGGTWETTWPNNKCRCINAEDTTEYCYIDEGNTSCLYSNTYNCFADSNDESVTCNDGLNNFQSLNGNAKYAIDQSASWEYDPDASYNHSPYDVYLKTIVPDTAETGNTLVEAVESNGTVCESNGVNFDITCEQCEDSWPEGYMCDLSYGSGAYGKYTSNRLGFCAEYPDSCCGNTGCKETTYEDGTTDGGTCYERPLLADGDSIPGFGDTGVCTNAEIALIFDMDMTTSDAYADNSEPDYADYIKLVKATNYSDSTDFSNLTGEDVEISLGVFGAISIQQQNILDINTEYYVVVSSDKDSNTGIVDSDNGIALGCDDDQITAGICTLDSNRAIMRFTTGNYPGGCPPDYVDLIGSPEFIDTNYTFISEEEEQEFLTSVYFNGDDGIRGSDDDQAIIAMAGIYDWDYTWSPLYDSMEDLTNSNCPVVGILTNSEYGSCSCNAGACEKIIEAESCTINDGDTNCAISTGETCYINVNDPDDAADDEICEETAGCSCEIPEESCTIGFGDESCATESRGDITTDSDSTTCDYQDSDFTDSSSTDDTCSIAYDPENLTASCDTNNSETCYLDPADHANTCDPEDSDYAAEGFTENQSMQTAISDGQEGEGWVSVAINGDGTTNDNWYGTKDDSQFVRVLFCDDADYLTSYSDSENQNFYFAYCRGSDPDNLLPNIEAPTIKTGAETGGSYLYEYLFTNSDNEDLLGFIIYPNDIDNSTSTIYDVLKPGIWGELRLQNFGDYSETTLDDYEAAADTYNLVTAAPNLYSSTLYPNIYILSINRGASSETYQIYEKIKEMWSFNTNGEFAPEPGSIDSQENPGCQIKKEKIIKDMKRVTDLGTLNYSIAQYKYLDMDGNGSENYPSIREGSYIQYFTTSKWSSWDSVLGNDLGKSLYTDPENEFADAATNCKYDEANNEYYDESGTCWDPINRDYKCPADSHVYQYVYDNDSSNYSLYANLELTGESWDWANSSNYTPCSGNEYSNNGCSCFNYKTSSADFITSFYHGACDTADPDNPVCDSESGYLIGQYCEDDSDCQIIK